MLLSFFDLLPFSGSPQQSDPHYWFGTCFYAGCPQPSPESAPTRATPSARTHSLRPISFVQFTNTNTIPYVFGLWGNRSTQRKPMQTWGEHANSTQKGILAQPGHEPGTCCEETVLPTDPPYLPQMDDIFGMEFGISMYLCVCVCVCVLVYATSRGPNVPTSIVKPEIVQTGLRSLQGKLY